MTQRKNRWRDVTRRARTLARQEVALLAVLALLTASLWGFLAVADEVLEGETHAIDEAILLALRTPSDRSDPLGPAWVEELGRDATALGGIGVLTFITVAAAVYLALRRQPRAAILVVIAITSGAALSLALKAGFDRPRPDLVPHGSAAYFASFPSGHSMMAAITYLTLGALLARLQPEKRLKAYVMLLAILMALAVGVSRIYLGLHWPTDVLSGWAAGAAWALMSWAIALWLQRSRQVEPVGDETDGTGLRCRPSPRARGTSPPSGLGA